MRDGLSPRRRAALDALVDAAVVAIVRDSDEAQARTVAEALVEAGVRALEITAPTPGCFETLRALERATGRGTAPRVTLGVGSVRTADDVARARDAGASFVVSPHTDPRVIAAAHAADCVSIPGALTPTEVLAASAAGADVVKLFPISAVGGARYVRLVRGPIPDVRLWVSGNVALDEIEEHLEAGVTLVGLSSALTGELGADRRGTIRARVARAAEAVAAARFGRWLLFVQGEVQLMKVGARELRALPAEDHVSLEAFVPGRRGQAVRVARLLAEAGIPESADVELASTDGGFRRTVPAAALARAGLLHWATDGHPLSKADGGPLRLYVVGGAAGCDNVKSLSQISVVRR
ncbi:molybdopterin-dependent oxidoreductase [Myxococcota bacterium]|nr:molybdopterin-dependent oxidoreductase [Myxococcota bacterium]